MDAANDVGQLGRLTAAEALRYHRHDILNSLQLIRAYVQLERSQDALSAVTDLAHWMQALSLAQTHFIEQAEPLLWTAAACSRVRLAKVSGNPDWTDKRVQVLSTFWHWANEQTAAAGALYARLQIDGQSDHEGASVVVRFLPGAVNDETLASAVASYICEHSDTHRAVGLEVVLVN